MVEMSKTREAGKVKRKNLEDANRQLMEYAEALNRTISEVKSKNNKLRVLALEMSRVEECERGKIAEDLHDHVGQPLAMARVKLQELSKSSSDINAARLGEIEDFINQVISYSRSMMFEISPNALLELGFVEAIEWLVEHIHYKYDLNIKYLLCERARPMNRDVSMVLFKAVRELLINIVRHARTDMAEVTVENVNEGVRAVVKDNGCGFDPSKIPPLGGGKAKFGLFNLRQRIINAGGSIDIDSSDDRGTRVSITLPQEISGPGSKETA